ncbi:C-type lectin domain family 4 member G isoform X1 [Fundulus heteroclitus]|uniref:C-type lectin domain family 4 member G isoform X1 n=1 Tax=Fundulus heteroclitus TaxID=8078 RepID=UPI00165BA8F4|nr:C-type lectin domain family 4 member G isoform X1 [Fundulus heteroclitus]
MEEEITYSTLVFQNKALTEKEKKGDITTKPGEKPEECVSTVPKPNEELIIYSEVKQKVAVTAGPKENDHLDTKPERRTEEPVATVPKVPAAVNSCITVFLVCLGILFLLLVVVVVVLLVNITKAMNKQGATINQQEATINKLGATINKLEATVNQQNSSINNLTAENQHLIVENRNLTEENEQLMEKTQILENEAAELSREKVKLNWTLEVILTYDNFPVKDLCPNKKCKPCLDGWMVFKDRCYLFYFELAPWKTWEESRQYCQNQKADLVVIDSLEEQEFISNHSSYYYDVYHGYWLGLRHVDNNWTWVDGRIDTLKYWIKEGFSSPHSFAHLIPERNYTENWHQQRNGFLDRFICECKALVILN